MPAFQAAVLPPSIAQGDSYNVFAVEAVALNQASERVAIQPNPDGSLLAINADILLTTAPTTATIDLQVAERDVDADFQTINSVTIVTPNLVGRIDLAGIRARFARLKCSALTGSLGNVTASIGR